MQRSDSLIKFVSVLLFIAVVIYIVFSLFKGRDTLKTVEAVGMELRESVPTEGYLVREERVVSSGGDGIAITVSDGVRVAYGETVAVRYNGARAMERAEQIRELQLRVEQLTAIINGETQGSLADRSVMELAAKVASGDYSNLYLVEANINAYVISGDVPDVSEAEAEIAALQATISALEDAASADTTRIEANAPGIFSQVTDGYEGVSPDRLGDIRPSGIDALFAAKRPISGAVGKLITGIHWYYVTTVPEEDAEKLRVGETATMKFYHSYNAELIMKVESVSRAEDGRCAVVFSSSQYMRDVAGLRRMTGELVFNSRSGIRVPRTAAHVDDRGSSFVYILEGLRAKKVVIHIVEESGDYYMVAEENGGLRLRDKIIMQAERLYDGAVVME